MNWPPKSLPRGFPLTQVERGYVVTVGGRTRWVCGKKTPKEAMAIYARKLSAWQVSESPLVVSGGVGERTTLHEILNRWLLACRAQTIRDELGAGSYTDYQRSAKRIDAHIGHLFTDEIGPDTIDQLYQHLHANHGDDAARRTMGHLRSAANEAEDRGWCAPMRLGRKLMKKLASRPERKMKWRLYTPSEIRTILLACTLRIRQAKGDSYREPWEQLRAMILLALNGGYGARELSQLPRMVIDLDNALIDYERGKTGEDHKVPLWPETIRALRRVMRQRPDDELVFRTRAGEPWSRQIKVIHAGKVRSVNHDNVAWAFNELVKPLGLKIKGQSFYKLKHLHATTGDAGGDIHASFVLTGHAVPGARGRYVAVGLDRLRKLVDYLRHELILNRVANPPSRAEVATASPAKKRRGDISARPHA